jgi:hypothetical protein
MEVIHANKSTILATFAEWKASLEQFPVTSSEALSIIGFARKDHMLRRLTSNAGLKPEYHRAEETIDGKRTVQVTMTTAAFLYLCLVAKTEQGTMVREWFLGEPAPEPSPKKAKVHHDFDEAGYAARAKAFDEFKFGLGELGPLDATDQQLLKDEYIALLRPSSFNSTKASKKTNADEAPPPPPLNVPGWEEGYCDVHKQPFYWHREKRASQWERPNE